MKLAWASVPECPLSSDASEPSGSLQSESAERDTCADASYPAGASCVRRRWLRERPKAGPTSEANRGAVLGARMGQCSGMSPDAQERMAAVTTAIPDELTTIELAEPPPLRAACVRRLNVTEED